MMRRSRTSFEDLQLLQRHPFVILLWLFGGMLAIAILWGMTNSRIDAERQAERQQIHSDTAALLESNAEQLARTIDYIDYLLLSLKYQWREMGVVNLEKQLEEGYFPLSSDFYVTLVDSEGSLLSTTIRHDGFLSLAKADFFIAHKKSQSNALHISKPSMSLQIGKEVVRFSRRLEAPDGSFAGLVYVSVEPQFFETFKNEALLGPDDCLSVRYLDGTKLAAKLGQNVVRYPSVLRVMPDFSSDKGGTEMAGEAFVDGKSRYVAWRRAGSYPVVAALALADDYLYGLHEQNATSYRRMATGLSLLFGLLCSLGAYVSAWLLWKKQQNEEIKDTYRLATDSAQEGFLMIRAVLDRNRSIVDFMVEDCNERGAYLVDFDKENLIGSLFSELYSARPLERMMKIFTHAITDGFYEDEFVVRHRDRPRRWLQRRLVRASDYALAMTVRDITEAKNYEEKLASLANIDALTSLRNRHWLNSCLPDAIEAARRTERTLALLFIDLDKFKMINDTVGHSVGDQVLAAVAHRIKGLLRDGDEAVRLGGDEFMVLLNRIDNRESAFQVSSRIIAAMEESFAVQNQTFNVSASIGVSFYPDDGNDAETLLKNADIAMYCAKEERRNGNIRVFQPDMYERMKQRAEGERELAQAIAEDQFCLHYQPRVDTMTNELKGLEALVRWQHPQRGLVPPSEFIPLAESAGLIAAIGEAVMRKACAQLVAWRHQAFPVVPVSVNVSASQFLDGRLDHAIAQCLQQFQLPAALLEIEITESMMMENGNSVTEQLSAIRDLGVQIHIDDFGTGYSSLSMLHRLDMDVLKIDRAFTSELGTGSGGEVLFEAIVSMAKALDMRVVAEGVEHESQRQILQSLQVDEIQGYLVSRPLSSTEVEAYLRCNLLPGQCDIAA